MTIEEQDIATIDLDALGDEIARTFVAIDKATRRALAMLAVFDERGGWAASGHTSCAAWLSWRTGMAPGTARERIRIARKLTELPRIDAAFSAGELSYSKVRALSRIADSDNEDVLVEDARLMTGAQLERLVGHLRRAKAAARSADDETVEPQRFFRQEPTDDGMVRLTFQLTADEAAAVTAALDAAPKGVRRAEALVAMADQHLRGNAPSRSPTEVVVHIDASSLEDQVAGHTESGELLGVETCRRLLCDAGVVPVLEDGSGKTLDLGRKTRTIPTAIRRAMTLRDGGRCRFPGCDNTIVDGHHIVHWAHGGTTCIDNVISACRRHHTLLHEGRATVEIAGDDFIWRDRDGQIIEPAPPRPLGPPLSTDEIDPFAACAKNDSWYPIAWPYVIEVRADQLGWATKT